MIALLAALWLACVPAVAKEYSTAKLLPFDEANREASFPPFREKLQAAVEKKDTAFLRSVLAQDIAFSLNGGTDGADGFMRSWNLNKHPEKSKLWPILADVLSHGGKFNDALSSFEAPYYVAGWPPEYNSIEFVAVVEKDVDVRAKPAANSQLLEKVSYQILRKVAGAKDWAEVVMPNGHRAFVRNKFLRSPVGYRARFEKHGPSWKLSTFILGN
jgi:hypothetical protein